MNEFDATEVAYRNGYATRKQAAENKNKKLKKEEPLYNFQEILRFLGFDYEFERTDREYPFNRGMENVTFS